MSKTNTKKIKFILVLLVVVLAVTFSIPSLARYKNYINLEAMFNEVETWDGSIASSYNSGTGTENDPYIISNASELAYFSKELKNTDYSGTYFKLSNNIILNDGVFGYDESNISYTLNDTVFYLDEYTGNVYENSELDGNIISTINVFDQIENFKGYFDGDYHTIYGLYLTRDTEELALFNNLGGSFENVYFKNSFVYGGSSTAVLANNVSFAEINNVSTEGIVVGTDDTYNEVIDFNLEDIQISKDIDAYNTSIDLSSYDKYNFDNMIITGSYSSTLSDQVITINGEEVTVGDFEINVKDVTSLDILVNDSIVSDITIDNLVLQGTYNYSIASGVIGICKDSNLSNIMNKANVYGINVSGLVGIASNISLSNSYTTGSLKGNNVSSIVNKVSNNDYSVINKVYNNGQLYGNTTNFIGNVLNSNSLVVGNSFNTKVLSSTFGNIEGNVQVLNVYDVNSTSVIDGLLVNSINVVTREEINSELLKSIGYLEYVDDEYLVTNPDNIWVYEYEEVPLLYVDELNNPIASLNIGVYSWNDLGYELKTLEFTESKAFNITPLNGYNRFKNVYYYIHDSEEILNKDSIKNISEWIEYEDVVSLDKEGKYIVYIKIVDQDDRNYYINSDLLFFDLEGPDITVNFGINSWNSYKEDLNSVYINESVSLSAIVNDKYSDVVSTEYYVSNIFVNKEDIDNWSLYEGSILIDTKGPNVLYIKSTDSNGHVNIINSDYIIYGGYSEKLSVGSNSINYVDTAHITDKSSVTYRITYEDNIVYSEGYNSNLVLSNPLPLNTHITLIDHKLNNAYYYDIDSNDLVISFNKFMKLGTKDNLSFDDISYLVTDSKDLSIVFDFSKATIKNNFTFNAYVDLRDSLDNVVLSTLKDSLKVTNVYSNLDYQLSITNKSVIYGINYDSDSKNVIDFEYSFNSLVSNNVVINDTNYEGMKTGILIKLVDSEGNIIDKKYLKNMEFIIDGVNYFADSDGIVRIKLSDNLDKVAKSLTIVTYENDFDLSNGDYSLVIVPFVASDGKYADTYSNSNISIPVVSDYEEILDYEFNVTMNNEDKILVKDSGNVVIPFEIISNNKFSNPSIRISLYKKNSLSAYDQSYSLIDLDDYSSNELQLATDYSYVIEDGKFNLSFDLSNLDKTGYEFRFELFDGDKRIDVIKKKIIVR